MLTSIEHLLEVTTVRGAQSPKTPNVFIEAPHGATRLEHYEHYKRGLKSALPADLQEFFFMNTDIGSASLAVAIAEHWVAHNPTKHIVVARCLVPRTFIDVNRDLEFSGKKGNLTAGLPSYIEAEDVAGLVQVHNRYSSLISDAVDEIVGGGGLGVIVHTYGPHTLPIEAVDHTIVEQLREVMVNTTPYPLRTEIDLITTTPEGEVLTHEEMVKAAERALSELSFDVKRDHTYQMHQAAMGYRWCKRYPNRFITLEVRRDLLVQEWCWNQPMRGLASKVAPIAQALGEAWATL